MDLERAKAFYARHRTRLWLLGLLPVVVVAVGVAVAPRIFYDHLVWEHLWGSAVADASQRGTACLYPDAPILAERLCVSDDYTIPAEIIYGAVMALAIFGIYVHLIKRFRIRVSAWFVGAILPFVLFGPVVRTLEDSSLFARPYAYAAISPFLYLQIAVYVVVFIILGVRLERSDRPWAWKVLAFGSVLGAFMAAASTLYVADPEKIHRVASPLYLAGSAALATALFAVRARRGTSNVNTALFCSGLAFLLPGLGLIAVWLTGNPWIAVGGTDSSMIGDRLFVDAIPYVLGIPAAIVFVTWLAARRLSRDKPFLGIYAVPVNLGILYGHMLDAFASLIAIRDPFNLGFAALGYGEKHQISNIFLGILDGFAFPLVKFAVVIGIVYFLDVEYRKDANADENLVGLVKMAILVLGLAPGLRDFFRMTMAT